MRSKPFISIGRQDGTRVARAFVNGALAGATTAGALAFLFDPDGGRRRRAELRDRTLHASHRARTFVNGASRDLWHRARGRAVEELGRLDDGPVDDRTLEQRVRAQLGHVSSHPRAIGVGAHAGRVELHGHVLAREAPAIVASVRRVRGVSHVDNQLQAHAESEHMQVLQGGARRPATVRAAPGPRLLAGAAGACMVAFATRRDSLAAPLATTAGVALLLRSMARRPLPLRDTGAALEAEPPKAPGEGAREPEHRDAPAGTWQPPERAPFPPDEPNTGVVPRPAQG
jgi:hypothetical protein